jgi:GT2 family glycosyltransferase
MEGRQSPQTLGIVLVNWNAGEQLRACLCSIDASRESEHFVLRTVEVVDNGSTDASLPSISGTSLPITIIRNPQNNGFGKAANQGAAALDTDLVLFLNPDCRLSEDSLETAVLALQQDPSIGVVGVRLIDELGHTTRHCARKPTPSTFWRLIFGLHRIRPGYGLVMDDWDHRSSRDADHVMGAFYLMQLPVFRSLGGFDERFFVYLEDLDLSLRVRESGKRVKYVADTEVFHAGGGTSRQDMGGRMAYMLESRIVFCFKHFSGIQAFGVTLGTLLIEPPVRMIAAIVRGRLDEIGNTWRGVRLLWSRLIMRMRAHRLKGG